jgi:hypothetical protein
VGTDLLPAAEMVGVEEAWTIKAFEIYHEMTNTPHFPDTGRLKPAQDNTCSNV